MTINDQLALQRSQAGLRLIAQTTLYNSGNFARLRTFIAESYAPALLESMSAGARLLGFRQMRADHGRLRVQQVLAAGPHHVVVLMADEKQGALSLHDLEVEADYPHRILSYHAAPLDL